MVELAEKLALEDNAQAKWPHIDEKYFEEAAVYYKIPDYRARNNEKERQKKDNICRTNTIRYKSGKKQEMMKMNIRTATLQDIDQIAAVEKECFQQRRQQKRNLSRGFHIMEIISG